MKWIVYGAIGYVVTGVVAALLTALWLWDDIEDHDDDEEFRRLMRLAFDDPQVLEDRFRW